MESPFPTKKFFIVLLFLVLVAGGAFKLVRFLNNRAVPNTLEDQKFAQNAVLPQQGNTAPEAVITEKPVPVSTLNAVAAVAYLNEQTKANGATMGEITSKIGAQIHDAKIKLDTDVYTLNDIKTSDDNSPEALKKYGNDMAGIFIKYGKESQSESYLAIIKTALEKKDPQELKKLDPYMNFYKNVIRDSLALKVPSSGASIHLHIINGYAEMLGVLQGFLTVLDDPTSAIASNSRLTKSSVRFLNSFTEADSFFKEKGVVFLPGEAGNLFSTAALK